MKVLIMIHGLFGSALANQKDLSKIYYPGRASDYLCGRLQMKMYTRKLATMSTQASKHHHNNHNNNPNKHNNTNNHNTNNHNESNSTDANNPIAHRDDDDDDITGNTFSCINLKKSKYNQRKDLRQFSHLSPSSKVKKQNQRQTVTAAANPSSILSPSSVPPSQPDIMNKKDFEKMCSEELEPVDILLKVFGISIYDKFIKYIKQFSSYTRITEITEAKISKCENVLYCMPWNWVKGTDDGFERLMKTMHKFQAIFTSMAHKNKLFFDGFILLGHSVGGCISILGTENWQKEYHLKKPEEFAPVLRVICVGSPINGSDKAIQVIEGESKCSNWFSNEQILKLTNAHGSKMLYELLPQDYLTKHIFDPRFSRRIIDETLNYYQNLRPSGNVNYEFIFNESKQTSSDKEDNILIDMNNVLITPEMANIVSNNEHALLASVPSASSLISPSLSPLPSGLSPNLSLTSAVQPQSRNSMSSTNQPPHLSSSVLSPSFSSSSASSSPPSLSTSPGRQCEKAKGINFINYINVIIIIMAMVRSLQK